MDYEIVKASNAMNDEASLIVRWNFPHGVVPPFVAKRLNTYRTFARGNVRSALEKNCVGKTRFLHAHHSRFMSSPITTCATHTYGAADPPKRWRMKRKP